MSTLDLTFLLERAERTAARGQTAAPLRILLVAGEAVTLPPRSASVRVLAGTAWLTCGGSDVILAAGQSARLDAGKRCSVVSSVGAEAVLVEVR